ncbi:unnamed protein product [Peronospora effusa]|uniref:Uncharacterized protein n=1 Tax=Peronospora effusa TaxID=542832 RepID=A0A3R7XZN8_9STRA|nr:hypothetical protein DD237_002406 [Peronospora effusa]CAI5718921.1 unnamed protein product [Peronospora effusa]
MRSSVYPHDCLIKLYAPTHCSGPHTRSTFTVYISTTGRRLWIGDAEECDDGSTSSGLTSVQDATQYVDQVQVRLRPVVAPFPTTVTVTHASALMPRPKLAVDCRGADWKGCIPR